jgi:hypothetical protein
MEATKKKGGFNRFAENFWRFPMRILGSPFKGFDEMKWERKGKTSFAIFVLVAACLLQMMEFVYTGFLINTGNPYLFNSLFLALATAFPIMLFVTANWSITTLLDGKGRYVEIFQACMYAMFPMVLLRLVALVLTRVLTLEEMTVVVAIQTIGAVLFFLYLFVGMTVIHEYTFSKTLGSMLLTIASMMVITFVLMLFFALVADVVDFFRVFIKEIIFKYF